MRFQLMGLFKSMSEEWRMAKRASMMRPKAPSRYHFTICCTAG